MLEWIDVWMYECVDGWLVGWMDGWMDGCVDGCAKTLARK